MEIKKELGYMGHKVLVFEKKIAYEYCELPMDTHQTMIGERTIKIGVFYDKERQIIGINTLNEPKWLKLEPKDFGQLFLKLYMLTPNPESFLFFTAKSDKIRLWWYENVTSENNIMEFVEDIL